MIIDYIIIRVLFKILIETNYYLYVVNILPRF